MTKNEVINRLCMLVTEVNHYKYKYEIRTDCFCDKAEPDPAEQFVLDAEVLAYIEGAVRGRLIADKLMHQ